VVTLSALMPANHSAEALESWDCALLDSYQNLRNLPGPNCMQAGRYLPYSTPTIGNTGTPMC